MMVELKRPTFLIASAILFNGCLFALFTTKSAEGQGQPVLGGVHNVHEVQWQQQQQRQCSGLGFDEASCIANTEQQEEKYPKYETVNEEGETDPMLMPMIDVCGVRGLEEGDCFNAYKRADISSFYQDAPGSRQETEPIFQGQAGKFINMSPDRLDLYWYG